MHEMQPTTLAFAAAWSLLILGVAHIAFALVRFKRPLYEAVKDGFIGKFALPELRRTAFWFLIFGLPLMAAGHAAVHAVSAGDLVLIRILGYYVSVTSIIGALAFPKSPFSASLIVAVMLVAAGYGW